jgi:hypothetical protein
LTIETEVAVSLLVDFLPLLSVALIVAGWFVIYRNAKKLSTRSETFAIVNRLSNLLEELGQDGTQYWSDTRPVEEYEAKLFLGNWHKVAFFKAVVLHVDSAVLFNFDKHTSLPLCDLFLILWWLHFHNIKH